MISARYWYVAWGIVLIQPQEHLALMWDMEAWSEFGVPFPPKGVQLGRGHGSVQASQVLSNNPRKNMSILICFVHRAIDILEHVWGPLVPVKANLNAIKDISGNSVPPALGKIYI